jgi:hypothetical protein
MFFVEAISKSGAGWPTIAFSAATAVAAVMYLLFILQVNLNLLI